VGTVCVLEDNAFVIQMICGVEPIVVKKCVQTNVRHMENALMVHVNASKDGLVQTVL
jgi:hypothetical protein